MNFSGGMEALLETWKIQLSKNTVNDTIVAYYLPKLERIFRKQKLVHLHERQLKIRLVFAVSMLSALSQWFVINVWEHPTQTMHYGGIQVLQDREENSQCCYMCQRGAERVAMKKFKKGLPTRPSRYLTIIPRQLLISQISNCFFRKFRIQFPIPLIEIIVNGI